MEQDIFLRSEKINNILQKHPEISLTEIKRIPEILDDPILIIKSRNARRGGRQNTRLVLFGSVRARNGQPVLVVLDLRPVENGLAINDMQKVNSAYARKNVMNYLSGSYVLYADKNRTIPLLRNMEKQKNQIGSSSNRLARTGPEELLRYGSMGSITYENGTVKLEGIPFNEVIRVRSDNDSIQNETENNRRCSIDKIMAKISVIGMIWTACSGIILDTGKKGYAINDMQKVDSAYTKDNDPIGFLEKSDVMYADKKRTISLLRTIGFQVPIELQLYGSLGSIYYNRQNVK